jgi:hypothetical protein
MIKKKCARGPRLEKKFIEFLKIISEQIMGK